MNDIILEFFKKVFKNNKMGHAYLIANTDYDYIFNELNKVIKDYIFFSDLELNSNPDVYLIQPDGNFIKKEQIIELENKLIKHSQMNNNKVYIIDACEKLHPSASNSLLKTLEEPTKNVYAFLISTDINKVLPTIKSRCQLLYLNSGRTCLNLSSEEEQKYLDIINNIDKNNTKEIISSLRFLYTKSDKQIFKQILYLIEKVYSESISYLIGIKNNVDYLNIIKEVSSRNGKDMLIKKIKVVNSNINLLEYNLNLGLFIDKFLIELRRCENE